MIISHLLPSLSVLINKTLTYDQTTQKRLHSLAPKSLKIEFLNINQTVYLTLGINGIELHTYHHGTPDIIIQGSPTDLLKLLPRKEKNLYQSGVRIIGDMGLAEEITDITRQLDIDWEEIISHYTGDIVAYQLGKVASASKNWLKESRQHLQRDTHNFLREETNLLPPRVLVDDFKISVATLRTNVERLHQRVKQLS